MSQHDPDPAPLLRVVRGEPTEDELAAVVVALLAASGAGGAPAARSATEARWMRHSPRYRAPGAWPRRDR